MNILFKLPQFLFELWESEDTRNYIVFPSLLIFLGYFYFKIFGFYVYVEKFPFEQTRAHKRRGNPPPSYPNGWFRIESTRNLKPGDVKYIKLNGRHIALFRGEDKIAYAVNAFCTHMGSNLGIGGQVKWKSCIECPFHGWTFNGKDGLCVISSEHHPRKLRKFEFDSEGCELKGKENGDSWKEVDHQCTSKIDTFKLLEQDGEIFCWFHSQNKEPFYHPPALDFKLDTTLVPKGHTTEFINCHIQDIPENGADFKHFDYVHLYPSEITGQALKFIWKPRTAYATDPDFMQKMGNHENKKTREWQIKVYKEMFKDKKNLPYMNVLCLDSYLNIFGLFTVFLVSTTVFQVGAGTVYLFFKFPYFEQILIHSVTPSHQFTQQVTHMQFATWWVPNWLCTLILRIFLKQVNSDQKIWNNKIFSKTVHYVANDYKDEQLIQWRNWYSQYYEGCREWQKKQNEMDW